MRYLIVELDCDGLMIAARPPIDNEEDARLVLADIQMNEPSLDLVIVPVLS
jgi:hypothetical protein